MVLNFCRAGRHIVEGHHNWMSQERCLCLIYCLFIRQRCQAGLGGMRDKWRGREGKAMKPGSVKRKEKVCRKNKEQGVSVLGRKRAGQIETKREECEGVRRAEGVLKGQGGGGREEKWAMKRH